MLDLILSFGYHGGGDDELAELTKLEPGDQGSVVGRIHLYRYHGDGDSTTWYERLWLVGGMLKTEDCTLEEYLGVPELVEATEVEKASVVYQGILKSRKDKQEEAKYLKQKVSSSYPVRGDIALVIANTGCGTLGRVFWVGTSSGMFGRNVKYKLGIAPTIEPWSKRWGNQENPTWTAQDNCITIPADVVSALEPGDAGDSPLGEALAFLLEYVSDRMEQIRRIETVLASPGLVAKFRLLGQDLRNARDALREVYATPAKELPVNPATGKRWVKKALIESHTGVIKNLRATLEAWVLE